MTSRQLLSKLKHDKTYPEYIESLENDIEVLEIIKKNKNIFIKSIDDEIILEQYYVDFGVMLQNIEEFNKIKEWLERKKL